MQKNVLVVICVYVVFEMSAFCYSKDSLRAQEIIQYPADAKVLETDVLQSIAGFKGELLDAEVIAVTESDDGKFNTINIIVPVDPSEVDRVQVTSPSNKPLRLKRATEISMDHENNELGIVLTLPSSNKLGFKLKLIDLPDE